MMMIGEYEMPAGELMTGGIRSLPQSIPANYQHFISDHDRMPPLTYLKIVCHRRSDVSKPFKPSISSRFALSELLVRGGDNKVIMEASRRAPGEAS